MGSFDTELLHNVKQFEEFKGATAVPIFQTSAFAHRTAEDMEAVFENKKPGYSYTRISNPTVSSFETRMAKLENGFSATACSSGSAAVASTFLTILKTGDEIIAPTGLYGGTLELLSILKAFGIKTAYVDDFIPENIEKEINSNTKIIFAEIIGNPKLNVIDVSAVADTAHKHGIPFIVDSTTATPYLIRPIDFGADIVIHSSSKYINSNGSAISGVIVDGGTFEWTDEKFDVLGDYLTFGKAAFTSRLRSCVWRNIGGCCAPFSAYLNIAGLETLGVRMQKICSNAKLLAQMLVANPYIEAVNYPTLNPDYSQLCQKQFRDAAAGGIVTIRVGSKQRAFKIINNLKYAMNVSNIGDTKTLVIHPESTIFNHSSAKEKEAAGVYDDLIRISLGIENVEDIILDFEQAINNSFKGC